MRVHFGYFCDGADWSDASSSFGNVRLGPVGMLSFIQTRLGLGGIDEHQAMRIDQYRKRLEKLDKPEAWFHASFSVDAWATAKKLLEWRDELKAMGWDGKALNAESPRIRTLSNLESLTDTLSPGFADKLMEALAELQYLDASDLIIELAEPLELLPFLWQSLFAKLRKMGVNITYTPPVPQCGGDSSLARMQRYFAAGVPEEILRDSSLKDDGSLLLVETKTEWEAAELAAAWLAAGNDDNPNVTLVAPQGTDILDHSLHRFGLPRLNSGMPSKWRAHLQILPLVLANAWSPIELETLVELLALPVSPVPSFAGRSLLKALRKEAGIGGAAWNEAMIEIREKQREFDAEKDNTPSKADALAEKLNRMLVVDRYPSTGELPETAVIERCKWIVATLSPRIETDPILAEPMRQADELARLVKNRGGISRVALERMLDSVIGIGGDAGGVGAEAAPWRTAPQPGAVTSANGTLLWWNFTGAPKNPGTYWSGTELKELRAAGLVPEEQGKARRLESFSWKRAFLNASKRAVFFRSTFLCGEESAIHPFWDEISSAANKIEGKDDDDRFYWRPDGVTENSEWQLAGRVVPAVAIKESPLQAGKGTFHVSAGIIPLPDKTSFSDMDAAIGCPLKWVLQKRARLYSADAYSLPGLDVSLGNLCHEISQLLFVESGKRYTPAEAEREALHLFDKKAPALLLELFGEGSGVELARNRQAVGRATAHLCDCINRLGFAPDKAEVELSRNMDGVAFKGFADLLLRNEKGDIFILDLKWTRRLTFYRDEVAEGRALQLASYAWLLESRYPGARIASGYYLLRQGRLLTDCNGIEFEAIEPPWSSAQTFAMGEAAWRKEFDAMSAGTIAAKGVQQSVRAIPKDSGGKKLHKALVEEATAQGSLYRDPLCRYCSYGHLCGINNPDVKSDDEEAQQ